VNSRAFASRFADLTDGALHILSIGMGHANQSVYQSRG
jgi:hypothetical protein